MNAIPAFYADLALRLAHERQHELRTEADMFRLAASMNAGQPRFAGIRAFLGSVREALATVDPDAKPALPPLVDYPSRG